MKGNHSKKINPASKNMFGRSLLAATIGASQFALAAEPAGNLSEAIANGKAYVDFRLRHESVDQDNPVDDASALTLRTKFGYSTGAFNGFSAVLEIEDSRIVGGVDDYTVGPSGFNPGEFSVVADPETTELDQGFVQYKDKSLTAKLGRQVITLDNHRFVGHVGWRQDRQTFDGVTASYKLLEDLTLYYGYIDQRNRIFADDADLNAKDHLLNAAYKTPLGTLKGYAYLLEVDNNVNNSLDTYGVSFSGSTEAGKTKILYGAEYATQESEAGAANFDADYLFLEGGVSIRGITAKLGYELLGSDDGAYGFATPLATLHKFNGWADQFLATPAEGLEDTYLSIGGKLVGGNWTIVYHDFQADESSATVDDLGSEIDISYAKKFGKHYSVGIKYASYDAGDIKVDTDKLWVWLGANF